MDVKQFVDRVLSGELKERRSLGRGPVQDTAKGIFGYWNAEDER
jgi:hypothetical protein